MAYGGDIIILHFLDEESKAQRGNVPRSYGWSEGEPQLEPRLV